MRDDRPAKPSLHPRPPIAGARRGARPHGADLRQRRILAGGGALAVLILVAWGCGRIISPSGTDTARSTTTSKPASTTTAAPGLASAPPPAFEGWVDPASSGKPWSTKVVGQLTFRGNPTRSYYGLGPVPKDPKIQWKLPKSGGWCGQSPVGNKPHSWCGSGWTGQPAVWQQNDKTWVSLGAYDKNVHFLDATDGSDLIENYGIGDIVKGSVTRDPDGFPLLYTGSRADFHVLAMDRDDGKPESLFTLKADDVKPVKWNDDWDGSSLVLDDYLFEGGENGQFHILKLNRHIDAKGKVQVNPKIVFHAPGWDDQLLKDLAGSGVRVNDVSIENSVAISGNTVYFGNSGGLIQGWDISHLKDDPSSVKRTFRFWTGDDTDASVVIDPEGFLYVAVERERTSSFARDDKVGQLVKLDPRKPNDPIVWSVLDPEGGGPSGSCTEASCYGIWATPAISKGVVYAATNHGRFFAVSMKTGKVLWEKKLPGPTWQSPVVVDDVLIQGDCSGVLHGYDVSKPGVDPPELWSVKLDGCIESTPTVFKGQIFVGARGGAFYALGDA